MQLQLRHRGVERTQLKLRHRGVRHPVNCLVGSRARRYVHGHSPLLPALGDEHPAGQKTPLELKPHASGFWR